MSAAWQQHMGVIPLTQENAMIETYVIGVYWRELGVRDRLYIKGQYSPSYARQLARNLKAVTARQGYVKKSAVVANLILLTLEDAYANSTSGGFLPTLSSDFASDHTLHIVNIEVGTVELWSKDGVTRKHSFTFEDFISRYPQLQ